MKSLSLTRPLIVMVIGIPGSGKSFFAKQFGSTFNAPVVSWDALRHIISPDSQFSPAEDDIVSELASQQLGELLKTRQTIILDGGVNTVESRQEISNIARKQGYGTLLIWVQTDIPAAEYRSLKRNSRRKGDEINSAMPKENFIAYVEQFELPAKREDYVVISGKHTYATQAKVVLKKLVAPRAASVVKTAIKTDNPRQAARTDAISKARRNFSL